MSKKTLVRSGRSGALVAVALFAFGAPSGAESVAIDPTLTEEERAAIVEMLEQGRAETEALLARAQGDLFTSRPAEDRWSVTEVLEHIAATEEMLVAMSRSAMAGDPEPEWQQIREAIPIDAFAKQVQDRSQRIEAPEVLHPQGSQTLEEGLARYHAAREKTLELVHEAEAPVKVHAAEVPVGKMTVHHLLTLIAAHNLRHNQQIAEALEQLSESAQPTAE